MPAFKVLSENRADEITGSKTTAIAVPVIAGMTYGTSSSNFEKDEKVRIRFECLKDTDPAADLVELD
ncbi:MAG: hypothetical protein EOP48_33690 [Sphingobacteriales bacterium]|nr:MAG: hypothetical protein EOP48_33690 [Sphingobacteriales bacterium]